MTFDEIKNGLTMLDRQMEVMGLRFDRFPAMAQMTIHGDYRGAIMSIFFDSAGPNSLHNIAGADIADLFKRASEFIAAHSQQASPAYVTA